MGSKKSDQNEVESSQTEKRTRDKKQLGMYLEEDLVKEVNTEFKRFNAMRVLNEEEEATKNGDFYPGLVRCALNNDWEQYVEEEMDRSD